MQTYPTNQWPAPTFHRAIDLEAKRRDCDRKVILTDWLDQVAPAGAA